MLSPQALLVVDDNEAELELMALTLEAAFPGVDIHRAVDALSAGDLCREHAFDCALLDYNMPDIDGLMLAEELRAVSAYLPIVLMTNVGDEMLAAEALRRGVSDYIPKSRITAEAIRRSVNRSVHVCGQARVIDEQRAELENFAYALAHDFKQPIRQIKIFAQMVRDSVRSREGEDIEHHLAFLSAAASRLGKLVDVMSQYTLLNETPELTDVDLNTVLVNIRDSLAPYLAERGARFITPRRAPIVRGNETLLTQVVQNLVMNGLQYNRSPVPQVEARFRREGDDHVIDLRDNGVGIAPEYLADIFKPLVRLHGGSEFPGTGLGLTLARKAALAQHGSISCSSTPDVGSIFHVRLPAAKSSAKPAPNAARASRRA